MEREIVITHKIRTSKCGNFCSVDCDFRDLTKSGDFVCILFKDFLSNKTPYLIDRSDECKGYDE
jgi:hypothetical protein